MTLSNLQGSPLHHNGLNVLAISCENGTYHKGNHWRLRRVWTSVHSRQSFRCSHTQYNRTRGSKTKNHISCPFNWLPTHILIASWQNQPSDLLAQWRLRSAWASAQSDRVFAVCSVGSEGLKVSSCGQQRLWSDQTDAQADLSLH